MKYWRGYLTAAILAFFTWALATFGKNHTLLIDRVYPYVTRLVQTMLADWSADVTFCLWQLVAILLIVVVCINLLSPISYLKKLTADNTHLVEYTVEISGVDKAYLESVKANDMVMVNIFVNFLVFRLVGVAVAFCVSHKGIFSISQ